MSDSQSTSTPSPLTQASPESLNKLFNTDPAELTDAQIETIVKALQADRERWVESESKPKRAAKTEASANLSLEDLDL